MKKLLVVFIVFTFFIISFSFNVGALGGIELGGRERVYLGGRVTMLGFPLGLSGDIYLPMASFDEASDELTEVRFLEVDPYLLLSLKLGNTYLYGGAAPIFIFDIEQTGFSFYDGWAKLKAGLQFGKLLIFFVEGTSSINFDFELSGIYSVHAGIGIGF
ncbi:MAG: hypothetical protein ACQESN_03280 [Thermotogota bacterium]